MTSPSIRTDLTNATEEQRDDPYAWHRAALAGRKPAIYEDEPQCGWYCRRTEYQGPLYPATIFWEGERDEDGTLISDEVLRCEVKGLRRDPDEEWVYLAKFPITQAHYLRLMGELFTEETYTGPKWRVTKWLEDMTQ